MPLFSALAKQGIRIRNEKLNLCMLGGICQQRACGTQNFQTFLGRPWSSLHGPRTRNDAGERLGE